MCRLSPQKLNTDMKGVGGPLLCVGDLISDLSGDGGVPVLDIRELLGAASNADRFGGTLPPPPLPPSSASAASSIPDAPDLSSDLVLLFEENYNELIRSLERNDQSWTSLTVKLCSTLETAYNLLGKTNSNIESLLEKLNHLESILKRGDLAVDKARDILKSKDGMPRS